MSLLHRCNLGYKKLQKKIAKLLNKFTIQRGRCNVKNY